MNIYDFAVGQTNPETFPVEAFKQASIRAIENEHEMFNKYHGSLGHTRLRELMAERESKREGVTCRCKSTRYDERLHAIGHACRPSVNGWQ